MSEEQFLQLMKALDDIKNSLAIYITSYVIMVNLLAIKG